MVRDSLHTYGQSGVQSQYSSGWLSRERWIEAGLLVIFWGAVALLTLGQELLDPHLGESGLREGEALHAVLEITVWALFTPLIFWIASFISPEKIGWIKTIPIAVALGVVVAIIVDLLDHIFWNTLVKEANQRSLSVWFILDKFHFLNEFFIYCAVLIAGFARVYFLRVREHRKEAMQLRMDAARLQANLAEARLRSLRMQINPHFLFNTLHIISDHFEEDPRVARRMIARLSDILRYSLEDTEKREAPLKRELEFLDGYLDIQRYRFEDRLQVRFDIEPEVMDALVPMLLLQPLVENAIKHGINQMEDQGIISIKARLEDAQLHLEVKDNGPGIRPSNGKKQPSNGIGLRNTLERLETLYGANQRFSVESPLTGGFIVSIVLPYHISSDYFVSAVDE